MPYQLKGEQIAAAEAISTFLASPDQSRFLLQGGAGTGKTYTAQSLIDSYRGRVLYTAPTNKATRVLRMSLTREDFKPECRTIYSALGLSMKENGEVKELTAPEDPVDLSAYRLVVLDEGSMVNSQVNQYLLRAQEAYKFKLLIMADFAQLPPVGEPYSPLRGVELGAALTTPRRFENQILRQATALREAVDKPFQRISLEDDHDGAGGVFRLGAEAFDRRLRQAAADGEFSRPDCAKAIAWRNATVDRYNSVIRREIFGAEASNTWLPGDRLSTLSPCMDLDGKKIADTDDEGLVERIDIEQHPEFPQYMTYRLTVTTDDNRLIVLRPLHPSSVAAHARECEDLAQQAKVNRRLWSKFWTLKEAFHNVRHGYATTAHRSQGSTYETSFVDWRDILANRNPTEARRCLYVAFTRAKYRVFLN